MISIQRAGGLGAISYPQQYSCTSTMCYGIGSYDQLFRNLEKFANQTAAKLGFAQVNPDGRIDAETARLVKQIIAAMPGSFMFLGPVGSATRIDFRFVAANADRIMEALQMLPYTDPTPTPIDPGNVTLADMLSNLGGDPPVPGQGPFPFPNSMPDDGIPTIAGRGSLGGLRGLRGVNVDSCDSSSCLPGDDAASTTWRALGQAIGHPNDGSQLDQAFLDAFIAWINNHPASAAYTNSPPTIGLEWLANNADAMLSAIQSDGGGSASANAASSSGTGTNWLMTAVTAASAATGGLVPRPSGAPKAAPASMMTPLLLAGGAVALVLILGKKKKPTTIAGLLGLGRSRRRNRRR